MNTSASSTRTNFWLALALALVASMVIALVRFHPVGWWNFAAVGALSLFVGARLRSWWVLALPLGLMLATDLWLSLARPDYPFIHPDTLFGYGCYVAIFGLGYLFGQTENPVKLGGLALGGSVLFFLVSNFGAWLNVAVLHTVIPWPGYDDYTADLGGLLLCYYRGLEFFPGTLAGDLVFAAGLFGSYAALTRLVGQPQARPQEVLS
jgi:hypothetical protein